MSLNNLSNVTIPNPQLNPNVNNLVCNNLTVSGSETIAGNISANALLLPSTNASLTAGVIDINGFEAFNAFDASGNGNNIFVGVSAGANAPAMTSASVRHSGLGMGALRSLTTGTDNTAVGWRSNNASTGNLNTYLGSVAGGNVVMTGSSNVGVGYFSLANNASGSNNSSVGALAGEFLISGSSNSFLGSGAGSNYTGSESNNVLISNAGMTGESGRIRIGTMPFQTLASIAGNLVSNETNNGSSAVAASVIPASAVKSGICVANAAATSLTFDTGANIYLALPGLVAGDVVKCLVINQTAGTLAISAGAGNSLGSTTPSIVTLDSRLVYLRKTGVGAYTIF